MEYLPAVLPADLTAAQLGLAMVVIVVAGFVKGAVGFAMPLILVSAFAVFLPADTALAGLILPTLFTNIAQALRQGRKAAVQTAWSLRRFLCGTVVFILLGAQFFDDIPRMAYLLLLGIPSTGFALAQLAGMPLTLPLRHRVAAEWGLGVVGGIYGGISGVWGPPLLVFLLSVGTDKQTIVRSQGVVFLIGSVALLLAHLGTGVLADGRALFSALLVGPALLGLWAGFRLQDRLDQQRFRRWTLILLVLTGLNLVAQAFRAG